MLKNIFALLLLLSAATLWSGLNILPNADLEKLDEDNFPLRWKFYNKDRDKAEVIGEDAASGKNFLRITRDSKRDAFCRTDLFRVRPGKYQISLQLRGSGAVTVTLSLYHPVKTVQLTRVVLTPQWQKISLDAEIPAGIAQAALGFRVSKCADLDDVRFVSADPAANASSIRVVNAGVPGNNSFDLITRLTDDVLAEAPDTVILMCGTNDMLNSRKSVPYERYESNLDRIITVLQRENIRVVLMTVPPCYEQFLLKRHPAEFFTPLAPNQKLEKSNGIVRKLAAKYQCPVTDIWTLFSERGNIGAEKSSWLRNSANGKSLDGIHPVSIGYRNIAEAVAATLKKAGYTPKTIVCFGDSITHGIGAAKPDESYPAVLEKLLNQ